MGLPAFDMSAFEAAQAALKPVRRAETSIILGPGVRNHVEEDGYRERIRKEIDQVVDGVREWRSGAFAATAQMRATMQAGLHQMPLSYLAKLTHDLAFHLQELCEISKGDWNDDERLVLQLKQATDEASTYSVGAGKYLRREVKRLEEATKLRRDTYDRLTLLLDGMLKKLDGAVSKDSLPKSTFVDDAARSAYVEGLRPLDLDSVAERTRRRLKQFPKTAAHLAR